MPFNSIFTHNFDGETKFVKKPKPNNYQILLFNKNELKITLQKSIL